MSITDKITFKIKHKYRGRVFIPSDFSDISSRAAIDQVLSRLVKANVIRRLGRGVYDYPRHHPLLGDLAPDVDHLARAIAGDDLIFLSGAMAANILRLSTQVPSKVVYMTNGISRSITIRGQTITFKHAKVPLLKHVSDFDEMMHQLALLEKQINENPPATESCRG